MIEAILAAHAATEAHAFENRGQSVGASEVGQCLRKIYYSKHGAPSSDGIAWGPAARGTLIEDHLLVPAFRAQFGDRFLFAGDEQQTFRREELSATPDGLLVDLQPDEIAALGLPANTTTIVTEFKTVDPRTRLEQAKPEHAFQVQAQLGLLRECTNHRPTHALIIYCNASDLSVREFVVEFDPSVYAAAKQRARKIMSASEAAMIGSKPRPASIEAVMATGAPKPAMPSMSAPKQNATSSSWIRRSPVNRDRDRRMTSKSPLSTERL